MTLDANHPVHPDNCDSVEQQDSRVIWQWALRPDGRYQNWMTHEERLRVTVGGLIGRLLRQSSKGACQEYLISDVRYMEAERLSDAAFRFAGTVAWGDGRTNRGWIAPFVLSVCYQATSQEPPTDERLYFGVADGNGDVVRQPQGLSLHQLSNAELAFEKRPIDDSGWAVAVRSEDRSDTH